MNNVSLNKYSSDFFGEYLGNDEINEICYNGGDLIWCENTNGKWLSYQSDMDNTKALSFAQAAASFKKDKIDKTKPILSCILPKGERVQIVVDPATKSDITSITIRKPSKVRYKLTDYIQIGALDENLAKIFSKSVEDGKNMVICGETGSGKTTFMKTLIDFIPLEQRIITIEDVEEIKFYEHRNFVPLFYPSEAKSTDPLNSATLLKSCLRMKPDRILLAEVRGAETYDFLNVISSGHNGSMTSCHAGSVKQCLDRLVMMAMQHDQARALGKDMIYQMVKDNIDVIIVFKKEHGKRQVLEYLYHNEIYKRNKDDIFEAVA